MSSDSIATPAKPGLKERAAHEFKQYAIISAYLAVLFSAVAAYTMLLNRHNDVEDASLTIGFALINALVLGKVILIGEMMGLGKRAEGQPLYQSILIKSVLFGVLIFAFHIVEEVVKRIIHHEPAGTVLHETSLELLAARSIIVLVALVPLFAWREIDRALGDTKLWNLLRQSHS